MGYLINKQLIVLAAGDDVPLLKERHSGHITKAAGRVFSYIQAQLK
jgi:hypothetical protein